MNRQARIVLHLDMDAFFAAVEQREDPSLAGRPVIIGHRGRRGVVATCSYEARRFGVRSAMPSVIAERLCPQGVWLHGRHDFYRQVSREIFTLVARRIPVLERVSVDEAYGEMTGLVDSFARAESLARELQEEIHTTQRLGASIGIGACRFVAKIASDLEKPRGLVVIPPRAFARRLGPLPVQRIGGVGPRLTERLARLGIRTISELGRADPRLLRRELGLRTALFLEQRARGEDDTPIGEVHERKQISEERTYTEDLYGDEAIGRELLARAEGVARQLRNREVLARTVVLKVRDGAYHTITRSMTLDEATDLGPEIFAAAWKLWKRRSGFAGRGLRLLGVGASGLLHRSQVQPRLFPDLRREQIRRAARASDIINRKFGRNTILPGRLLKASPRPARGEGKE
ncbi:MAG: DNA polymerase IV [Acidobacteriota bacterium]|nr:DNA polymerase IV [Acidobacteriota bacterium]